MERAIILAAGSGRRLMPLTAERPKVLVEIAGEPILLRMMRQLVDIGVRHVTLVVGDREHLVRAALERAALAVALEWVVNREHATTNNSWSLALAGDILERGAMIIEGDVIVDQTILEAVRDASPTTCWSVRPFLDGMEGARLECDSTNHLRALSIVRAGSPSQANGWKSMGILKVSPSFGSRLATWLRHEVSIGRRDRYYDQVIASHLDEAAPVLLPVDEGFWAEVDTPEDLAAARRALKERA